MRRTAIIVSLLAFGISAGAQDVFLPSQEVLQRPFGDADVEMFASPDKIFYPEVWVDCLCGNMSEEGILADLEAIKAAGFSGVQFFFGNRGGAWPGVEQMRVLSPRWDAFVKYAAEQAERLGLRFTLQNCPGWAMAGGPWITPDKAMRHLTVSRVVTEGGHVSVRLPMPPSTEEDWRDYRDLMVLAFRTPDGDNAEGGELSPVSISPKPLGNLPRTDAAHPHVFEIEMPEGAVVRTVEFSSVQMSNHWFSYDPGINGRMEAVYPDGTTQLMWEAEWPASNWQDDRPLSIACNEVPATTKYRLTIVNAHADMGLSSLRFFSSARKTGWESEAAWCLRSIMRDSSVQSPEAFVGDVVDLSSSMAPDGKLDASLAPGEWTILRFGHVNTGKKNAPAVPEATGFECNKYSTEGAEAHFAGYVGKFADGPLKGLLDGMLLDSWECETQTWTEDMETEFKRVAGYDLRPWMPALFGYVVGDKDKTTRFLRDWRATVNDLVVNKFYGRITELGHSRGLSVTYETAGGDVFPSDIMEYFKWADIPMCEFWIHDPEIFVGTLDFKPIKPTASAGRLYGKPRVAVEAYTSQQQTWDEQLSHLREHANKNLVEGGTYFIYQAYSHNPRPDVLVPGSSFGDAIGTPFLRAQTWWRHMHDFNDNQARVTFMLEKGRPVSDVLWYLGDEIDHKPHQEAPFPAGHKYDYCNPDILLNRLSVENGRIVTPEGLSYEILWLPQTERMLPETLEKIREFALAGATIVGERPRALATLKDEARSQERFDRAVSELWDGGLVISDRTLQQVLDARGITPDLSGADVQWLHRQVEGADWYFVCAPKGGSYKGTVSLRTTGAVEIWDPVTGQISVPEVSVFNGRTIVKLSLELAQSVFVVVRHDREQAPHKDLTCVSTVALNGPWTLSIPAGWGLDKPVRMDYPTFLQDLDIPEEAKAFSGTMTYSTRFRLPAVPEGSSCVLRLGKVQQIAKVVVNGTALRPLWCAPYEIDVKDFIRKGVNTIEVEVTDTWYNRLAFDSALPEEARKTWTTNWPAPGSALRPSGLQGPVTLEILK